MVDFNAKQFKNDNPDEFESSGDFELIPAGVQCNFRIERASEETTQDGTGIYWKIAFVAEGGQFTNRWVWQNFNIKNKSTVAEKIAQKELTLISEAIGIDTMNVNNIIGAKLMATTGIDKGSGGYSDRNKLTKFKPLAQGSLTQTTGNAGGSGPGWARS